MDKGKGKVDSESLANGEFHVAFPLPQSVQDEIAARVGTLMTEGDIRRLRVRSSEKMREEIRNAVKSEIMKFGLFNEIKASMADIVKAEIAVQFEKITKDGAIEKQIRAMFQEMIEAAAGKRATGSTGSDKSLSIMMEQMMGEEVKKFVADKMIIRCIRNENEGSF